MRTSDAGIYALALHEGIVPGPYKDSVGVWTYGIGHTAGAGAPDPAKMARGMPDNLDVALADVFTTFRRDLPKYEAGVNKALKVPVTQSQFDALVSFHYNTGAIAKASFVKKLNAGDMAGAVKGFMAWNKPAEIIPRREAERDLFAKGVYPGGTVTVWGVTDAGKVIWKPVKRLNMPQVLALLKGAPLTRPNQKSVALDDLTPSERRELADHIEAELELKSTVPPMERKGDSKSPNPLAWIAAGGMLLFGAAAAVFEDFRAWVEGWF